MMGRTTMGYRSTADYLIWTDRDEVESLLAVTVQKWMGATGANILANTFITATS